MGIVRIKSQCAEKVYAMTYSFNGEEVREMIEIPKGSSMANKISTEKYFDTTWHTNRSGLLIKSESQLNEKEMDFLNKLEAEKEE